MSQPSPLPESILDAAADWLVLIHSGEITEIQLQQFEQWKSESIVKLLYYSYKIRKKLEITHRLSRSTILYAYV